MGYIEIGKIYFCSLLLKAKINGDWGERVRREMVKALTRMGQTRKIVKIDFIEYLKSMIIYIHLFHPMAKIKNEIVIQDPTEKNIRKALNFGHTLGHAIESYFLESETKTTLLHGEAIAIGMILESYISLHKNLITNAEYTEIKTAIKSIYDDITVEENDIEPILELLVHDKKNEYGLIQFALIEAIGKIKINQLVENKLILDAFEDYKS
jgi:3-dehydroquinate synthase